MQPEREALESLIYEMYQTWGRALGIMFELVRWETHVTPAFGSDPQAVINSQIGDNYDVFIGILWARFGTPTPRAASGTMEEFERAYARVQAGANNPEIMFYFKEAAVPISKIDPEQLKKVQNFRGSLPEKGGVYATFEDLPGFSASVRVHLSSLAQKFSRDHASLPQVDSPQPRETLTAEIKAEDELGFLDYVEISDARIEDMVATMELISEATVRMGSQFEGHMRETTRLATAGPDTKSAKRLIKRCADDMQAYAGILKNQTPILAANREAAFDALSNSLTLHRELGTADNSNLRALNDAIEQLRSNLAVPTESMKAIRETAASFPRMTSDLNKAKRLVVEQIDALIEEFDKTDSTATNILLSMAQML
ncbi:MULTISPECIES: hypothetical protein [Paraburkholderia]|uniref:hypothetical protein n=1 Tax=Paraburkholderia TaxID=1822464 RepID=UPI0038BC118A